MCLVMVFRIVRKLDSLHPFYNRYLLWAAKKEKNLQSNINKSHCRTWHAGFSFLCCFTGWGLGMRRDLKQFSVTLHCLWVLNRCSSSLSALSNSVEIANICSWVARSCICCHLTTKLMLQSAILQRTVHIKQPKGCKIHMHMLHNLKTVHFPQDCLHNLGIGGHILKFLLIRKLGAQILNSYKI